MAAEASQKSCRPIHVWKHVRKPVLLAARPLLSPNLVSSVAVSPFDFPPSRDRGEFYVILNDLYVLSARQYDGFPQGYMSLSEPMRTWASISLQDVVNVKLYDPFTEGGHRYLGSVDAEVGFAGKKSTEAPFDQDELAQYFTKVGSGSLQIVSATYRNRTTRINFLHLVNDLSWTTKVHSYYSSSKLFSSAICPWIKLPLPKVLQSRRLVAY